MLYQLLSYTRFLLKSTNQHGVHSPFVYQLITNVLYNKNKPKCYQIVKDYIGTLKANKSIISVKDYGAGSKNLDTKNRKVASIAKNAGITKKRAIILNKIIEYYSHKKVLELGTSLGIATASMGLANNKTTEITTLEGCPNTAKIAKQGFNNLQLNNITIIVGEFKDTLAKALHNKYDIVYFDGNHQKKPTIDYFEQCLPYTHNETLFIFDDIYWSKEMQEAWQYIKSHPKVTVSIDTFYWGLVFFRKEQPKQHFTIRL